MPNHVLTIGLCGRDYEQMEAKGIEDYDEIKFDSLTKKNLCEQVMPMPVDGDVYWCREHWGTRWGTYSTKVQEMGGDGSPILIEFQSAWNPPKPEVMRLIDSYLCSEFCLKHIRWMVHDPYDNSVRVLEVAEVDA